MNDQDVEKRVRQMLDSRIDEPDELTRAALKAARYRALEQMDAPARPWWQGPLAFASVLAVALLGWQLSPAPVEELQVTASLAEDAAVIADLDLVLWLEENEV